MSETDRIGAVLGGLAMCAVLLGVPPERAEAQDKPAFKSDTVGGPGGTHFEFSCGTGKVLVGVKGRAGMWLDNISFKCATVSGATLGAVTTSGSFGGTGGTKSYDLQCPSGHVVKGLSIYRGSYVHQIGLYCRIWQGTGWGNTGKLVGPAGGSGGTYDRRDCLEHSQPVVAVHGRRGWYVNAIGITCDEVT